MDVIIEEEGCQLSVEEGTFLKFTTPSKEVVHRLVAIKSIQLNTTSVLSGEVLEKISEYQIHLSLIGKDYETLGEWYGNFPGKSIQLKYKQMQYILNGRGRAYAAQTIYQKILNQISWLDKVGVNPKVLVEYKDQIEYCISANDWDGIFNLELFFSKAYYKLVCELLPDEFKFDSRSRMPAKDPFNALINYSYSYLYRLVEDAITSAGLDVYLGFYHSNERGGKSLVYDLVEEFRPWVDECVVRYCQQLHSASEGDFYYEGDACKIGKTKRKEIMELIKAEFDKVINYRGVQRSRSTQIYYLTTKLKTFIRHGVKTAE